MPELHKRIEIDGDVYGLQKFKARKAIEVFTRLSKLIGEPFALFAGGMDIQVEEVMPRAVRLLLERVEHAEVLWLIDEVLKCVTVGGGSQPAELDPHFQGRLVHLSRVLTEALKFQYGDFSDALAALSKGRAMGAAPRSVPA